MYVTKNYCADFWLNNVIVDCCSINLENNIDQESQQQDNPTYTSQDITINNDTSLNMNEYETNELYKDSYSDIEKLNKIHNHNNKILSNEPEINRGCGRINYKNFKRKDTRNDIGRADNKQTVSDYRLFSKEETSNNISVYKYFGTNKYQRKMQELPKTSRLYEFRKRKVLLDSFAIPAIIT
jgi:hypothetical protein